MNEVREQYDVNERSLCDVSLTEFCSMNFTSSNQAPVADTDYLSITCRLSYLARSHWVPRVRCHPNVVGQTEFSDETAEQITYTKSFNATPGHDGAAITCAATFNSTGYEADAGQAENAPDDVNLWTSPPLRVQCKRRLHPFHTYAVEAAFICGYTNISVGEKLQVVVRKVAKGLRFDCGQYGSFTVFAVYCGCIGGYQRFYGEPRLEPHVTVVGLLVTCRNVTF